MIPEQSDTDLTFVVGFSMFPTLQPGDEVIDLNHGVFHVGDVVAFCAEDRYFLHRIVKIENKKIFTKGDNNTDMDPLPIKESDIMGRVEKVRRDKKIFKVRNGLQGRAAGMKCQVVSILKRKLVDAVKSAAKIRPVSLLIKTIGQAVCNNHFSIIKQKEYLFMIFCRKAFCGYYDSDRQEWLLRRRFKLILSHTQLNKIIKQIEMKKK